MKKIFLYAASLIVITALMAGRTSAQGFRTKVSNTSLTLHDATKILVPSKSEVRAFKSFNRKYKNAVDVNWYHSGEILVASFKNNNKQTRVFYLSNGKWLHTLIYYDESQLSRYIKSAVKNNYQNFNITGVVEAHENGLTFYFINIENEKEIKQVIFYGDEVWTHKEYQKM